MRWCALLLVVVPPGSSGRRALHLFFIERIQSSKSHIHKKSAGDIPLVVEQLAFNVLHGTMGVEYWPSPTIRHAPATREGQNLVAIADSALARFWRCADTISEAVRGRMTAAVKVLCGGAHVGRGNDWLVSVAGTFSHCSFAVSAINTLQMTAIFSFYITQPTAVCQCLTPNNPRSFTRDVDRAVFGTQRRQQTNGKWILKTKSSKGIGHRIGHQKSTHPCSQFLSGLSIPASSL